jgi:hypothetical protein
LLAVERIEKVESRGTAGLAVGRQGSLLRDVQQVLGELVQLPEYLPAAEDLKEFACDQCVYKQKGDIFLGLKHFGKQESAGDSN